MIDKITVAQLLLKEGALKLSPRKPFTYASGLKGPIYCDNRRLLSFPLAREQIVKGLVAMIANNQLSFDAVMGIATAGIPWATLLANHLQLPLLYIRGKEKQHGLSKRIEGVIEKGMRVVLVEDLINQASSLEQAIVGCQQSAVKVTAGLAILSYQTPRCRQLVEKMSIPLFTLTDFEHLLKAGEELGELVSADIETLRRWQLSPEEWSNEH